MVGLWQGKLFKKGEGNMSKKPRILVIGNGAREHATVWHLAQTPGRTFFAAPGTNAGIAEIAIPVPIDPMAVEDLALFAQRESIDLTFVGPDRALEAGIADTFRAQGLTIFAPTREQARIESSKAFAKDLMGTANIPSAASVICPTLETVRLHLAARGLPVVMKWDGLAEGKGVHECRTEADVAATFQHFTELRQKYGDHNIVVEDLLEGVECSIHALCDGYATILFPIAQDHKHLFDGNRGPMTGGMGAVVPFPMPNAGAVQRLREMVVDRLLRALQLRGIGFSGCLYPGLMLTETGESVLEYNARPGDPEWQTYCRLTPDLLPYLTACAKGHGLEKLWLPWCPGYAVSLSLVSAGYGETEKFPTGFPITGIEEAETIPGVIVFHAGTRRQTDGTLVTAGGRVLSVTATGATLQEALDRAYQAAACIRFHGKHFRRDIGTRALARQQTLAHVPPLSA